MATRTIAVDYLARVEGEGALTLTLDGDRVVDVELRIFEPPRLFESLLRGRDRLEAPDVTSRICGICPVAYQMSACRAIESAAGVTVDAATSALRRLLYCGEWIESHVLHVVMLHAPDFLGVHDALALAKSHPERVKSALRLKKAGNALMSLVGGREIHPINVRVGGFHRPPTREQLDAMLPELRHGLGEAEELLAWASTFTFPEFEREVELVALAHPSEYAILDGRIVSSRGLDIDVAAYEACFVEEHVAHSTALHTRIVGRGSPTCGPLARMFHSHTRLPPRARAAAERAGMDRGVVNPYRSILARCVEVVFAFEEAIRLVEAYEPPRSIELPRVAGTGHGCTEAPRGILYHRYAVGDDGCILDAKIVPPTSQNQRSIELDLVALGPSLADLPEAEARRRAEHAIRNYDPCISCATHFLDFRIVRCPA